MDIGKTDPPFHNAKFHTHSCTNKGEDSIGRILLSEFEKQALGFFSRTKTSGHKQSKHNPRYDQSPYEASIIQNVPPTKIFQVR